MLAFEAHQAGQELLITYGESKAALDFLRDYGFVVSGSPGRIHFVSDAQDVLGHVGAGQGAPLLQNSPPLSPVPLLWPVPGV